MATKKKAAKPAKMTAKQKYNLELAQKPITAPKASKPAKARKPRKLVPRKPRPLKTGRRWLDTVLGDIHTVLEGDALTVHLTVNTELSDMTVGVNGRAVWKGKP